MTVREIVYQKGYEEARKKYERPHGEWTVLMTKGTARTPIAWKCSICGKKPAYALATAFCPNCGADMREKEEEL